MTMPLNIPQAQRRFRGLIGVGGIGAGSFFALNGNHTLGREESRGGHFLDRRDYCKLHIITHYVKTLLGGPMAVIPIGKVGDDDQGRRLLVEMAAAGLEMRHVTINPGAHTLYSFCLVYPDGSGGNLTTEDSASGRVDQACVLQAEDAFAAIARHGIALAVPEVPLDAREALLALGTRHGLYCVAAFTSGEIPLARARGLFGAADLLALNLDEAAAVIDTRSEGHAPPAIAEQTIAALSRQHPALHIAITAGRDGSWVWDGSAVTHHPAIDVPVAGTAGAGDAFLAGVLAGLAADLPLSEAQQLGMLVAGLSVTSPHTIHPGIDRDSLRALAANAAFPLGEGVSRLLEDGHALP